MDLRNAQFGRDPFCRGAVITGDEHRPNTEFIKARHDWSRLRPDPVLEYKQAGDLLPLREEHDAPSLAGEVGHSGLDTGGQGDSLVRQEIASAQEELMPTCPRPHAQARQRHELLRIWYLPPASFSGPHYRLAERVLA